MSTTPRADAQTSRPWIDRKIAEIQRCLDIRHQDSAAFRSGTDESWKAAAEMHSSTAGRSMSKDEREKAAQASDRIAARLQAELSEATSTKTELVEAREGWRIWKEYAQKADGQVTSLRAQLAAKEQELAEARRDRAMVVTSLEETADSFQQANFRVQSLERQVQGLEWTDAAKKILSERDALRQQLTTRDATIEGLREALGMSDVWSLPSTLRKLCEAVRHLKDAHQCDGDGHEQFYHALEAGERLLPLIEARLAQIPPLPSAVPQAKPVGEANGVLHCSSCDPSFSCWNRAYECRHPEAMAFDSTSAVPVTQNANDRFEAKAAAFYRDTGMLAPGKDDRSGIFTREERQAAWDKWCAVPVHPDTARLLDQLEKELRGLKDHANECAAGSPPDGYEELEPGSKALAIADACYHHGLDAMETAIANWIFDHRSAARQSTGEHGT